MKSDAARTFSRTLHAVVAVAFLFVLLVEWGSHSLAFVHHEAVSGMASINVVPTEHGDPCKTMTCCEGRDDGRTAPNFSHHLVTYFSQFAVSDRNLSLGHSFVASPFPREGVRRISRPKDPLLHPPELS